jgi:hypothetical protein
VLVKYYQRPEFHPLFIGATGVDLRETSERVLQELSPVSWIHCLIHRLRYRWFLPERLVVGPGSVLDSVLERLERDYRSAKSKFSQVEARLTPYLTIGFGLCFELRFRSSEDQGWVILEQAVLRRFDGNYEVHRYVDDR